MAEVAVPCLIREVFYAPPCPESVALLFEVGLTQHNTQNYSQALNSYMNAYGQWEQILGEGSVPPPEARVFLRLAVGSVLESAGSDEGALAEYLEAQRIAKAFIHGTQPIHACVESSLGTVYCHLSQYDLAADAMYRALELRENTLGPEHADTGLMLNNVGACLHFLGRPRDALVMYYRAEAIFTAQFRSDHPRTTAVQRNITRARQFTLHKADFVAPTYVPQKVQMIPGAVRARDFIKTLNAKGKGKKKK